MINGKKIGDLKEIKMTKVANKKRAEGNETNPLHHLNAAGLLFDGNS